MISITPLAQENLTSFLLDKKLPLQVRISSPSKPSKCGGEDQLILVTDSPGPGDMSAHFGPLILCLSRELYEQVGSVRVDFRDVGYDSGFVVECEPPSCDDDECAGCTLCD
jgi:Fe-S cluster assembly iron-binding protein IscA